jgi:CHAT domain-containing protein/tetratricopeptide (TPR) repeat protein
MAHRLFSFSGTIFWWLAASLALAASETAAPPASDSSPVPLPRGGTLEGEIAAGQSRSFEIPLAAGERMALRLRSENISLALSLHSPEVQVLVEIPDHSPGVPTDVLWVAETTGPHRVDVSAPGHEGSGRYFIELDAPHAASEEERRVAQADASGWRGRHLHQRGSLVEAMETYEQGLVLAREAHDARHEAWLCQLLGIAAFDAGQFQRARENLKIAGERVPADDPYLRLNIFNELSTLASSAGDFQSALALNQQVIDLLEPMNANVDLGVILSNRGNMYFKLGNYERALESDERALALVRAGGAPAFTEGMTLLNVGTMLGRLGRTSEALARLQEALALARSASLRPLEGGCLQRIGVLYVDAGDGSSALAPLQSALEIFTPMGDRRQASVLTALGKAYGLVGRHQEAIDVLERSLTQIRETGEATMEATVLLLLADNNRELGRLTAARARAEEAAALVESSRPKIAREDLRLSHWALSQKTYDVLIDVILAEQEKEPDAALQAAALEISERSRARTLREMLLETQVDIREGIEPALLAREREVRQLMNLEASRRLRRRGRSPEGTTAGPDEMSRLTDEYQRVQSEIRASSPRYASLTQPAPITLAEIQALLDEGTVLLEYDLGPKNSTLWAVTRGALEIHRLPKQAEIEELARRFHDRLTARNRTVAASSAAARLAGWRSADEEAKQLAETLSRFLLAPLRPRPEWRRLVIVADGALHYVPFTALPLPPGWTVPVEKPSTRHASPASLVQRFEVATAPSAAVVSLIRQQGATHSAGLAVLADPVFDREDPRVQAQLGTAPKRPPHRSRPRDVPALLAFSMTEGHDSLFDPTSTLGAPSLPRLEYTRELADSLYHSTVGRPTLRAVDFEASRQTATAADLARYRTVVFASHALMNSRRPELSGIVLSLVDEKGQPQDGVLRLPDVYNLKLDAELVVLGACETALGEEVKGEGLIALSRGFMYAGARRVLASLWMVDEEATMELLKRFLRKVENDKMSYPEALRQAQLEVASQARWAAPYYWSGFVLQGDWK